MSLGAVLLNGLVAVPFGFALLTWLLIRREGTAVGVAVLGGLVTFGWSVWAYLETSPVLESRAASISRVARLEDLPTSLRSSGESVPMLFLISVSSAERPRYLTLTSSRAAVESPEATAERAS